MDRRIVERRGRMKFTRVIQGEETWAAHWIVESNPESVAHRKTKKRQQCPGSAQITSLTDPPTTGLLNAGICGNYRELQVHGGASLDDVERVIVSRRELRFKALRQKLIAAGYTVTLVD